MKKERVARSAGKGTFTIIALGCPKNIVEAEVISGSMLAAGWSLTLTLDECDCCIIDTCAFLPAARREAAAEIKNALRWKQKRPGRKLVVAGCLYHHADLPEFQRRFPQVDLWVPVNDTARIPELLAGKPASSSATGNITFLADETLPKLQLTLPHVAYLKISDGCNNRCAYCAIPHLRGALRSRSRRSVMLEAERMLKNGVKEIIVIAQDITAFGHDRPSSGETLASLLREMDALPGDFWIRLLYTHPAHYTDELIDVLAQGKHILPYLDIPMQHISNRILKAMNRHVTAAEMEMLLAKLRMRIPGLVLRTTFITGLPGESEEEFNELCDFTRRIKFDRMGVFSYAPEPGTPAAEMLCQISPETADKRAKKLLSLQMARMKRKMAKSAGQTFRAIVDDIDEEGVGTARAAADAPEIDNVILFRADKGVKPGDFVSLTVTGVQGMTLTAQLAGKMN